MNFGEYSEQAKTFRYLVEIGQEYMAPMQALHGHFNVADEEWREMCAVETQIEQKLVDECDIYADIPDETMADMAEEMADVLVTMHVMADMLGIDLKKAYDLKMDYNLEKTAEKDDSGKVTDDVDVTKPDFREAVGDDG